MQDRIPSVAPKHFELNTTEFATLRGSVGIYIVSKTSAEVADSLAELSAAKNSVYLQAMMHAAQAKTCTCVQAGRQLT
jgi:xanthine/CO dehydrogenase XdhC/CoxF family maturation factor